MDAIPLHRRPTSLNAMLTSIVSMMEPYASDIGVKLKIELGPGLPPASPWTKIRSRGPSAHSSAMRCVMCRAGRSFTQEAKSSCAPGSSPETDRVLVEVIDDGPGIPSDKLPLLFQPAPYQRRIGYALILAREIVEGHGGRMEAESTDDPHTHGTTIRLVLPPP